MPQTLTDLIKLFIDAINSLLPVVGGLALLAFLWGLVKFISKAGDESSHTEGRNLMVWGVIAIFVMISFLGITSIFYSDFGFTRPFGIPFLPPHAAVPLR